MAKAITADRQWCYDHLRDSYTWHEMVLMSDEEMTTLREAYDDGE